MGILQVGVGHVNMQTEAWWEEKLSDGSVSLTRLCKIIQTNRRPVVFTPAAVAVQRHSDSSGGRRGRREDEKQRDCLRLYTASLDKRRAVSHPYGFLLANPTRRGRGFVSDSI